MHAEHMHQLNVRSRERVKYRQNEKDAVEAAQIQEIMRGKTVQEQDIIMRQLIIDDHAKQKQDEIDRHLKQEQEAKRYYEMMQNATPEQERAIVKKIEEEFSEKRRKQRIDDDELDKKIENLKQMEKEAAKQVGNNMFTPNSGQYGAPVQYSLVPSQSPVTVQVWSY